MNILEDRSDRSWNSFNGMVNTPGEVDIEQEVEHEVPIEIDEKNSSITEEPLKDE